MLSIKSTTTVIGLFFVMGFLSYWLFLSKTGIDTSDPGDAPLPVAILGDSDSHSYRDKYDNKARGGDFHSVTYNWPALWDRFRSEQVNLGAFGTWGESYRRARIKNWLKLPARAPKKLDFDYNYAISGLRCQSLLEGWPYQAKWLISRLQRSPDFWEKGLVIIRIGVNNLGSTKQLEQWGVSGLDKTAKDVVSECVRQITEATEQLLASHPSVKIAILGMCRDCNLTESYKHWPTLENIKNRDQVLGSFDQQLKSYVQNKKRVLFIDDVAWQIKRYSDRYNEPIKLETRLADKVTIKSRQGDHPSNLILADYHAGTVYNGFWLNNLIEQLNQGFELELSPLSEEEILSVILTAL